jgi:hypothetical protein
MAIKTFTTGEVLAASDTNTYLANSGLVYITEANPSGASSVSINNCFSATYNSYRIVWNGTAYSSTTGCLTSMRLRVGGVDNTSNNYYRSRWYYGAGGTSGTDGGATLTDGWSLADSNTPIHQFTADVFSPFQSVRTSIGSKAVSLQLINNTLYGIESVGVTSVTTSYDGFTLFPSNGTFTGKLIVYGYRQA